MKFITAFLLLGVYSAVIFHNIVPHIHYASSATDEHNDLADSSHDHGHAHHHTDHAHDDDSNWLDELLGLFGGAEHPDLGDDHFESFFSQTSQFEFTLLDLNVIDFDADFWFSFASIEQESTSNHIGHPKILYEQYYVCSVPLRGPPSIS